MSEVLTLGQFINKLEQCRSLTYPIVINPFELIPQDFVAEEGYLSLEYATYRNGEVSVTTVGDLIDRAKNSIGKIWETSLADKEDYVVTIDTPIQIWDKDVVDIKEFGSFGYQIVCK